MAKRARRYSSRDGDQLLLFSSREMGELPWRGGSARVLTRVAFSFSVGAVPARGLRDDANLCMEDAQAQLSLELGFSFDGLEEPRGQ